MKTSRITDTGEWDEMVNAMPLGHFFQLPEWSRALCMHFRMFQPNHLMIQFDNQDRFILPMVRRQFWGPVVTSLYSLPLGTFGGIVGEKAPTAAQCAEISEYLTADPALNVVVSFSPIQAPDCLPGFFSRPLTTHIMVLDRPYDLIEREKFSKSKRESVGRARRRGVEVRREKTSDTIEAFCMLVAMAQQEKSWATCYSPSFIRHLIDLSHADLWTGWYLGKCACGIIAFSYNQDATAWLGAMDHSLKEGQPMNLLKAEMMRYYGEKGYKRLDLGASLGIDSLEKYKQAFGCNLFDLPIWYRDRFIYRIINALCKKKYF